MDLREFDALLHEAEVKLKRLKALYDQWFQGIERTEPSVARKDLDRHFALLQKEKPRNTAARFRLQQLVARYSIYATYWQRIARQIEEGTYERDLRRMRRERGASAASTSAKVYELDFEEDADLEGLEGEADPFADVLSALEAPVAPAPAAPKPILSAFSPFAMGAKKAAGAKGPSLPAPRPIAPKPVAPKTAAGAAAPARPSAEPSTGTMPKPVTATFGKPKPTEPRPNGASAEDAALHRLYDTYVEARRRNNEAGEGVAYEKLAASVREMTSKLREKHGDKKIEFEVVVQNGKVGLKPKIG